jgi:diphthamide biosynthesis methyltransferase
MKNDVLKLKNDLDIIEGVSIFNIKTREYVYSDENSGKPSFVDSMNDNLCLNNCEFLYIDLDKESYFLNVFSNHAVIVLLNRSKDVNNVILQMRIREFCEKLN